MQSIHSLIESKFYKLFYVAVFSAVLLSAGLGYYFQQQKIRSSQLLAMEQLSGQLNSLEKEQNILFYQKYFNEVLDSLSLSYGYRIGGKVSYNDQKIANKNLEALFGVILFSKVVKLDSGNIGHIELAYDVLSLLVEPIFVAMIIIVIMLALFRYLIASQREFVRRFIFPLNDYVTKLDNFTHKLSVENVYLIDKSISEVKELAMLQSSVRKLVNEILLLERQRASLEINEAKFDMARKVAHDIRAPIAALKMLGANLKWEAGGQKNFFESIVVRVENIANDLLHKKSEVRKFQAPLVTVEAVIEDIKNVLREKELAYPFIGFKFISRDSNFQRRVFLDRKKWVRILSNLLNNAIEASGKNDCITVEYVQQESEDLIKVIDKGKGIPQDILARLGKSEVTHGKSQGVGIGFLSSKQFIEECGGHMKLESELAKGTTVTICLKGELV